MKSLRYRFIVSGSRLLVQKNLTFLFLLPVILFLSDIPAYAQSTERMPVIKDQLREQYTEQDFQNFLEKERSGEIPEQGGPVYSPAAADALANNNTGATATAQFTQSETSILAFGNNVLIGFNDSGSLTGGANKFTGFSYSSNGGASFTDGGTLPTNAGGDAGDPVLARNETTGRIYFSTLGYSISTIQVFRSDDNGINWTAPVNGTPGGSSEDKQWIAVDNFPGAGNGNVYLISRRFAGTQGIYFFRSIDNGGTFTPNGGTAIVTAGTMQGAFVAVGTDHSVYVFWYAGTTLQMRRSTDQGLTFASPVTVASGLVGGTNGDLGLTGIRNGLAVASAFRSSEFPHAAVNPVNGHIYVTYANDAAGADKADIFLVTSINSGATWSTPQRVNDDATTTDQWQPAIAVTPDGYNIGIFYYSRQEDAANNLFKYYGRTGTISGSTITFSPAFAISDAASLPEFGRDAVVNSLYMGDYNHASATPGKFHVVWSDNRADLSGGAPRKDPNVYYESITVEGPPISQYLVWEGTLGGQDYSGLYIKNFLLGKGYTVDYTSVFPAALTGYNGVFLSFGNYGTGGGASTPFNTTMAAAVQSYLEAGGKVYLEGGDALEFDQGTNTALHALFGIGDGDDGLTNAIDNLQGQAGTLTNGMLFNSSTQVQNAYIDLYVPTTGTAAFVESAYGNVAVQYAGTYGQRTFCFSYALAALSDGVLESTKNEMLTKILSFFDSPAQVPDINVSPLSLSFSIPVGGTDSDILTISNQGNASLNWNIYEENVFAKIRLNDGRELPVKIQPKFEWKQPVKGESNSSLIPQAPNYPGTDVYSSMGGNYLSSPVLAGPECSGGLINDDGSVENGYRWNLGTEVRFVSRFDPPSYPYDLGKVCLAWTQDGSDASINYSVVVYDDDGPGGTPGTLLATIPATSAGVPAWPGFTFYDVNVAGSVPAITSGRVFIGATWSFTTEPAFFLCADETATNIVHPGYMYYGSWLPMQDNFPYYRTMFIRAEQASSNIPWITESPLAGTITAASYADVTISVDAAGLTPGNYLCQLIISSNDPYEPEVVVPVSMEVQQSQFLVFEGVLGGQDYSGAYIKNFITGLGYTVDYTSVFPTTLIGYDAAFLSFGNYGGGSGSTIFTAPMAAAVQAYLEAGGKVYLEGGDALEFNQGANAALHALFGLGTGSDGSTNIINGLQGQVGALTANMLFNSSTQAQSTYIDIYVPTTGTPAFVESAYGNVAVQYAGTNGQKTFCFSYALAYLTDAALPSTKQQLIANIFNFLTGISLPAEINVSPPSLSFTLPTGGVDSDILTISNTGLGNLNWLINERDPAVVLRTQDGKELPVTIQPKFEWKQPVKGKGWLPPAPSVTEAPADGNKLFSYESSGDLLLLGNNAYSHHNGENFVQFDLGIPQVLNPVAPMTNSFWAADYGTDLTFAYAVNYTTNQFVRINKTTGAVTVVGSCAPPHPGEIFTGMGIDLNTNIVYLSGTDVNTSWLYTVNTATGALTQIGTVTNAQCIIAIAIDNDGTLYGYDMNYDVMLTINKTTCAGTVLGPIGFNASYGQGMDFDPATGELYLAAFNSLTFKGELRIANKVTGNTTYLGDLGSTIPGGTGTIQLGWLGIPGQKFDCTWLAESPVSGTITPGSNQVVTVSVNAAGLAAGTYNCNLVIISNDSNEPETIIPVTLNVTTPPDINVSPSSLTFTVPEGGSDTKVLNIANTAPAGYSALDWILYEGSVPGNIVLKMNDGKEVPVNIQTSMIKSGGTNGQLNSKPELSASGKVQIPPLPDNLSVLYDQTDSAFGGIAAQNFEPINDLFDCFAGDDFEVTGGSWLIESVDIPGQYFSGPGPASSVNVWFYSNAAGLPGTVLYSALNVVPAGGLATGSFNISLPLPAVLPNGHYWLVVQTNMNYTPYGQWGWSERSVQSFSPSVWKNPGGGFGTSCTNWEYRVSTCTVGSGPDFGFRLNGVVTTGVDWISESPASGTLPPAGNQNIDVTANAAGLTAGVYNCALLIYSNDPDESPVSIPVTLNVTPGTVTANYNVIAGWNMISLPLSVSNPNYLNLFPTAVPNTLYGFNGGYFQTANVGNNTGYWLKFPGPLGIPVQGSAITNSPITLIAGWNMIGGPYCNVPLANISDPGNIIIPGTLYSFSSGYINVTSVDATKGYWIKANAPGTININCTTTLAKGGKDLTIPAGVFDPFTKIHISDAADHKQTLYFAGKLDGSVSIESFSLPPAAPAGSFDARLSGEYILSESDEVSINVQSADYPISIKVSNLKPEEGYTYTLKEMAGSQIVKEHIITEGSEILLINKDVNLLVLTKENTIPSSFDLAQNYPNPFNPTTLIKYTLPESREVSLIIYNSLGEKIKTLVSGIMEAGYYTVTWDATNDYGRNVGSGTYLYSLRAGDYYSVKKMVLVK